MYTYLGLYEHQIDKQHHKIVLYIFICEPFAARALREAHAFSEGPVIRFAVRGVEGLDGVATFYTDGHLGVSVGSGRFGDVKWMSGIGAR
jgi:hypothetical protein